MFLDKLHFSTCVQHKLHKIKLLGLAIEKQMFEFEGRMRNQSKLDEAPEICAVARHCADTRSSVKSSTEAGSCSILGGSLTDLANTAVKGSSM